MSSLLGVSLKCQYALRATFELARRYPATEVSTVADLARAQQIPVRFLEQILAKMRTGGYVISRRGKQGGYVLAVTPANLKVGEVIRFIEGPDDTVQCLSNPASHHCASHAGCVFRDLWQRARDAVNEVVDGTTFQDLVDQDRARSQEPSYDI
jgi:Rrf2 family protein